MIRKYRIFLFALFALLAAQAMHAQSGIASRSFSGGMTGLAFRVVFNRLRGAWRFAF